MPNERHGLHPATPLSRPTQIKVTPMSPYTPSPSGPFPTRHIKTQVNCTSSLLNRARQAHRHELQFTSLLPTLPTPAPRLPPHPIAISQPRPRRFRSPFGYNGGLGRRPSP